MLRVVPYNQIDRKAWSRLVQQSSTGTWFQTPEAYDFLSTQPKLFAPFVVAIMDERFGMRGVCVGYVTNEQNGLKHYFTRRAIIMGGPCLAEDATNKEAESLMNTIRNQVNSKAIYIETRNFNDYTRWKAAFEAAGFAYKPHLNFHVDPVQIQWSDNRKRQIKKSDAICELAITEYEIREWYEVLQNLYRTKVKTPLWPVEFFLEAYRQGVGKFLLVKHEGKVIGGSMVVKDDRCVYEWFECGMNAAYKDQYPSVMATWAGIQYAKKQGCTRYDMMGAGEPGVPYGVRDFKSEFGGTLVEHGRFLCVCRPGLYRIGSIAVKWLKGRAKK